MEAVEAHDPDPFEKSPGLDELRANADLLSMIREETTPYDDIWIPLNRMGYRAGMPGMNHRLNVLRRHGYIRRMKGGYRLAEKGRAWHNR